MGLVFFKLRFRGQEGQNNDYRLNFQLHGVPKKLELLAWDTMYYCQYLFKTFNRWHGDKPWTNYWHLNFGFLTQVRTSLDKG